MNFLFSKPSSLHLLFGLGVALGDFVQDRVHVALGRQGGNWTLRRQRIPFVCGWHMLLMKTLQMWRRNISQTTERISSWRRRNSHQPSWFLLRNALVPHHDFSLGATLQPLGQLRDLLLLGAWTGSVQTIPWRLLSQAQLFVLSQHLSRNRSCWGRQNWGWFADCIFRFLRFWRHFWQFCQILLVLALSHVLRVLRPGVDDLRIFKNSFGGLPCL